MIELVPSDLDDVEFIELAQRIVNGALLSLRPCEVYLVHVDNWFDHKWLGFWSTWDHKEIRELYVPPFNPNRIRSQRHFIREPGTLAWTYAGRGRSLHLRQPGRRRTYGQPLERLAKSAAFIWYSGNTAKNGVGSLMAYLTGAEAYAWYASFARNPRWRTHEGFGITQRELVSFQESGRKAALASSGTIPPAKRENGAGTASTL